MFIYSMYVFTYICVYIYYVGMQLYIVCMYLCMNVSICILRIRKRYVIFPIHKKLGVLWTKSPRNLAQKQSVP